MTNNKFLAWTSFMLFVLSLIAIVLFLLLATVFSYLIENPGVIILAIGAFALLATVMGFLSFKVPQAKVGGIGGLVILLLVLFVIPVGRETSVASPGPEVRYGEQAGRTGIAELDHVIDTVLANNPQDQLQLLQFISLACTHAEGLGGPPKCGEGEKEGTLVDVFPFLGPEGHHMRRSETGTWEGIQTLDVYAVYRNSQQVYSDEAFPAGEYAIVFFTEQEELLVTTQVTNGKIVRIDNNLGNPPFINFERDASTFILEPQNQP